MHELVRTRTWAGHTPEELRQRIVIVVGVAEMEFLRRGGLHLARRRDADHGSLVARDDRAVVGRGHERNRAIRLRRRRGGRRRCTVGILGVEDRRRCQAGGGTQGEQPDRGPSHCLDAKFHDCLLCK